MMKLVQARGMDEALYDYIDNVKAQMMPHLQAKSITTAIQLAEKNDGIIRPDLLRVNKNNEQYIIEKLKSKKWNKLFSLPLEPAIISPSIQQIISSNNDTLSIKDVPNNLIADFLLLLHPEWKITFDNLLKQFSIMLLNVEPGMQNYNDTFSEQLPLLFEYAKGRTKKNSHIFNDHDNGFYQKGKDVIIFNQNYQYTVSFNNNTYKIKTLVKSKDENESLNTEFLFHMDDNNKQRLELTIFDNPFVLTHFMIDLKGAIESYMEENNIQPEINPIVKTYAYHLAYMSENFSLSKEDILWRMVFYCFPSGADEDGNYNYDSEEFFPFQKTLVPKLADIHETITHSPFKVLVSYHNNKIFKKIKYLNDDWKMFFKDAHDIVADYLEKYKAASPAERKTMTYCEKKENLTAELEEFLVISDKLVNGKKKTKKLG